MADENKRNISSNNPSGGAKKPAARKPAPGSQGARKSGQPSRPAGTGAAPTGARRPAGARPGSKAGPAAAKGTRPTSAKAAAGRASHPASGKRDAASPAVKKGAAVNGGKKEKKPKKKRTVGRMIGMAFLTVFIVGILVVIIGGIAGYVYINNNVDTNLDDLDLNNLAVDLTSTVYYMDSESGEYRELEELHGEQHRIWAEYEQVPQSMKDAFVAIEDERFWKHHGVDWKRTLGAFLEYAKGNTSYGGSTITQQLIKNVTNEKDVTPQRKIKEIIKALELERNYSKELILNSYMNTVYFSQGCYGVQAAANVYFGKDISELDLAECAAIAAITNNPTYYDLLLNPENNKQRQTVILDKMQELGMITQQQRDDAVAEELQVVDNSGDESAQSYFVDEIIKEVQQDLIDRKGYSEQYAQNLVYRGGLKIYATIDPAVQQVMDEEYANEENFQDLYNDNGDPLQSAMVITQPNTGAVLGIVGGRGTKEGDLVWSRASDSVRQPGSSIKPLSVYAPGIDQGLITWGSAFDDAPIYSNKAWPRNFDERYVGLTSVQYAVEVSLNTVPCYILENVLGFETSYEYLTEHFGITSLVDNDKATAPLALGGLTHGVSVREMSAAFNTFASGGKFIKSYTYTKVEDRNGEELLSNSAEENAKEAISPQANYVMIKLLQTVVDNNNTYVQIPGVQVAGKTGTTDGAVDRWFCGFTPYYTGAVWTGFDDNSSIPSRYRVIPPLKLWSAVMDRLHEPLDNAEFEQPEGVTTASFCMDSGMIPTSACSADPRGRVRSGWYVSGTTPGSYCDRHKTIEICSESGQLAGPYCPNIVASAKVVWERKYNFSVSIGDASYLYTGSTATCTLHTTPEVVKPEPVVPTPVEPVDPTPKPDPDKPVDPDPDNPPVDPDNPDGGGSDSGNTGGGTNKPSRQVSYARQSDLNMPLKRSA